MANAKKFTSTAAPHFCVEGRTADPRTVDGGDSLTEYQPTQTASEAERFARAYHRRGLWAEIFSQDTKKLLAGPFDPDEAMPKRIAEAFGVQLPEGTAWPWKMLDWVVLSLVLLNW